MALAGSLVGCLIEIVEASERLSQSGCLIAVLAGGFAVCRGMDPACGTFQFLAEIEQQQPAHHHRSNLDSESSFHLKRTEV